MSAGRGERSLCFVYVYIHVMGKTVKYNMYSVYTHILNIHVCTINDFVKFGAVEKDGKNSRRKKTNTRETRYI